jgi:hypothetical protein
MDPVCDEPGWACGVFNQGVVPLCLPTCDPLVQDCPEGDACYVMYDLLLCMPDHSGPDAGAYGDPCEFINVCDPGLLCIETDVVPGCQSPVGCCSPLCDTTQPNTCPGMADGEQCLPIWDPGDGPPEWAHVGVCRLP